MGSTFSNLQNIHSDLSVGVLQGVQVSLVGLGPLNWVGRKVNIFYLVTICHYSSQDASTFALLYRLEIHQACRKLSPTFYAKSVLPTDQ